MAANMKLIVGEKADQSCRKMMQGLNEGRIKKHLLGNSASQRHGYLEQKELSEYQDFIKTKGFADIMELTGSTYHE